jgi:hypothetical protein
VGHNSWSGRCPLISDSSYANVASFSASEGADPFARSIFRNPPEVLTTCPMIFLLKISYMSFLRVPPLPCGARSTGLHPSMPFVVGSFICLLPRSCYLRHWSLMPFLHSGPFLSLFSNIPPFGLLGATSSLFCSLRLCPGLIYRILAYGIVVWGQSMKALTRQIFTHQKGL